MDTRRGALDRIAERAIGPFLGAVAVIVAGAAVLALVTFGPVSNHMALHIASMNIAAPLIVIAWRRFHPASTSSTRSSLWSATFGQLALLWAWHSPTLQDVAHTSAILASGLHAALFLSALFFWTAIVDAVSPKWEAILALLVSGKLTCLLGALLIFSPRLLYDAPSVGHAGHSLSVNADAALADQHLAGLLMIAACPLSFVLTAIILAAQAMADLRHVSSRAPLGGRSHGR